MNKNTSSLSRRARGGAQIEELFQEVKKEGTMVYNSLSL